MNCAFVQMLYSSSDLRRFENDGACYSRHLGGIRNPVLFVFSPEAVRTVTAISWRMLGAHQARGCNILMQSICRVEPEAWSFYRRIFVGRVFALTGGSSSTVRLRVRSIRGTGRGVDPRRC